ncbi:MAG: hypothetical protein FWE03_01555 [Firmicutes bacterium]|nr:hypothetical protein [Bacillota bacterium]
MKRLTKQQLRVIISVNFLLIVIMGVAIFLLMRDGGDVPTGGPDPDYPPGAQHSRRRTAQISLNPFLSWELELVGEAQSIFSYVREQTNTLFIFGNALSAGYDFDSEGVFVVAMDVYGVTREGGFWSFGAPTDRLRAVSIAEGGFILAIEGALPYLLHIDFNGEVISRIDGFINAFESIHSIRHYGGGFLMFTKPQNVLTGVSGLRAVFFDSDFNFRGSGLADSIHSLELVEIFVISGRVVVFANASSGGRNIPSVLQFNLGGSTSVTIFDNFAGRLMGVTIHNGDFLMMVGINGSSLLRINNNFMVVGELRQISIQAPVFFDMLDVDGNYFLALFERSGAILNDNLVNIRQDLPTMNKTDMRFISNATIFVGTSMPPLAEDYFVTVNIFNEGDLIMSAPIRVGDNANLALSRRHLIVTFNMGNTVVVSSLRYPLFL